MVEKRKNRWGVPSQLENINGYINTLVSYLNFNNAMVKDKFGERSEEIMNVLNEVKAWLNVESDIVHKEIISVFEKKVDNSHPFFYIMDITKRNNTCLTSSKRKFTIFILLNLSMKI